MLWSCDTALQPINISYCYFIVFIYSANFNKCHWQLVLAVVKVAEEASNIL